MVVLKKINICTRSNFLCRKTNNILTEVCVCVWRGGGWGVQSYDIFETVKIGEDPSVCSVMRGLSTLHQPSCQIYV